MERNVKEKVNGNLLNNFGGNAMKYLQMDMEQKRTKVRFTRKIKK